MIEIKTKIAVGIPAYNATKTLPRLLASIKSQSVESKVFIIADADGLGQKSYEGYAIASDVPFTVYEMEKNVGPGLARQKAIDLATDEDFDVITFIDADDVLLDVDSLYRLVTPFEQDKTVHAVFSPFLQEVKDPNNNRGYVVNNDPNSPWVFGKMYNLKFLKEMGIGFSELRAMEDGEFNAKIRMNTDRIVVQEQPTYIWSEGSEHSITRLHTKDNPIPVYNYGLCQIGADECFKRAVDFTNKKNPFNPQIKAMVSNMMVNHYFTYFETLQEYSDFANINEALSRKWYNEVFTKYCSDITDDTLNEIFMQSLSANAMKFKRFPSMTFEQWLNHIRENKDDYDIQVEVDRLKDEIKDLYKKSGVLSSLGLI